MKRKLFMIVLAAVSVCVMVSCGSKDGSKEKADAEQVAEQANENESDGSEAAPNAEQAIVDMVNALYDDIDAVSTAKSDVDLIDKYCSKDFKETIAKVREIDSNKPVEEGYGLGDNVGDRLWTFFDSPFEVEDIEVSVDGNEGNVSYKLSKDGEKVDMIYGVVCEDGQWRFSDCERIGMMGYSWMETMTQYIEENQ